VVKERVNKQLKLLAELSRRAKHPLKTYVPGPNALRVFQSTARYVLVEGPNGCIHGDSLIWDPVANAHRKVSAIGEAFHVYAWDGTKLLTAKANKPFTKPPYQMYEVTTDLGETITVAGSHRFLTPTGYRRLEDMKPGDELVLPDTRPTFGERSQSCASQDPRTPGMCPSFSDPTIEHASGIRQVSSLSVSGLPLDDEAPCDLRSSCGLSASVSPRGRIVSVTPTGKETVWDFEVPEYHNYWFGGCINHNTGKTHLAAIDISLSLSAIHKYRPNVTGQKFVLFVPSRDQAYDVWRPRLLGKGAAPTSLGSGGVLALWDMKVKSSGRPEISWTYAGGKPVPTAIMMKNGNELRIRWSGSNANKRFAGDEYYAAWIDEPGNDMEATLDELVPRFRTALTQFPDHGGRIVWPATDVEGSEAMATWRERAADPEQAGRYEVVNLTHEDNPAVSIEAQIEIAEGLSEEGRAIRVDGTQHGGASRIVYPMFQKSLHVANTPYIPGETDNVVVAYDPGIVGDDTGLLFSSLCPENPAVYHLWHFLAKAGMTISEEVAAIKQVLGGRLMRAFIYDPHMTTRIEKGTGKSILTQLFEAGLSDRSLWAGGRVNAVKPKMKSKSIAPSIKRVKSYLKPDPLVSACPLISLDPPNEHNGLRKFVRDITMTRLKKGFSGVEITATAINQKNQEAHDTLRMLCVTGFQHRDLGRNMSVSQAAHKISNDDEEARRVERQRIRALTHSMRNEMDRPAQTLAKKRRMMNQSIGGI